MSTELRLLITTINNINNIINIISINTMSTQLILTPVYWSIFLELLQVRRGPQNEIFGTAGAGLITIGVGDGGQPPPLNLGQIFFRQLSCKIQAFSGQISCKIQSVFRQISHKIPNFVNFSGEHHKNLGVLIIFRANVT